MNNFKFCDLTNTTGMLHIKVQLLKDV